MSCLIAFLVASCRSGDLGENTSRAAQVDQRRLIQADQHAGQWMAHGRDFFEQRFSPLTRITDDNVKRLGLAWYADFDTRRAQEATPLVIDGALYVSTAWSKVYAFDAKTGKPLWKFDPQVARQYAEFTCCDVVNRGIAAWKGRLFLGTLDGRLIAIDAATGRQIWSQQTTDPAKGFSVTGAPRVANGRVLIGQQGSEFAERGYFSAYSAETGDLLWRWYIVPGDPSYGFENEAMKKAAATWGGEWWKAGGGGSPWDGITYDPTTDYVIFGTGNGSPWPAELRSPGNTENLYLSSIVALNAATGEYAWHYQTTPHDSWDLDAAVQITIADIVIDGRKRHVAMQGSKNGFFYVLDARTGEFISASPLVPGINWTTGIDPKTGVPAINSAARYDQTGKGFVVVPGLPGAHSWHPMSFSPRTGLVYIPVMLNNGPLARGKAEGSALARGTAVDARAGAAAFTASGAKTLVGGYLLAWNPVTRSEAWRVTFDKAGRGGGVLSTAGNLVFQGNTYAEEFAAYRADTGEKLWSMQAQTGVVAGPVTYEVEGEQYIAVVAGQRTGGNYYSFNGSRVLVFKLDGSATLPSKPAEVPMALNPPEQFGTTEAVAAGNDAYHRLCANCHGASAAQSRALFPDLRFSGSLQSTDAFKAIVLEGALASNGMVSYQNSLSPEEAEAIRAYLVNSAHSLKARAPADHPKARP